MNQPKHYREALFDAIANTIENVGKNDPEYTPTQKSLDILDVLENLLAYTIYSTCNSLETVRDSAEESYVNIKKRALHMMKQELEEGQSDDNA